MPITGLGAGKRSASERILWRSISFFHSGNGVFSGTRVILNSLFETSGRASGAPVRDCAARPTSLLVAARAAASPLRAGPADSGLHRRPWSPERRRHSRRGRLRSWAIRAVALAEMRRRKRLQHRWNLPRAQRKTEPLPDGRLRGSGSRDGQLLARPPERPLCAGFWTLDEGRACR